MFTWIKEFFGIGLNEIKEEVKKVEVKVENTAAAVVQTAKTEIKKVEEAVKCGCGRSPTGFCVGLHKLSDAEWKKAKNAEEALKTLEKKIAKAVKDGASKVKAKTTKKNAKK